MDSGFLLVTLVHFSDGFLSLVDKRLINFDMHNCGSLSCAGRSQSGLR